MRVYLASHGVDRAGAEKSLQEIVYAMRSSGMDVLVTLPAPGYLEETLVAAGVPTMQIPTRRWMGKRQRGLPGLFRVVQSLLDVFPHAWLMRREHPDVVVVNTGVIPAPLVAAWLLRIPRVLLLRESLMTNPTLQSFLPRPILRWSLHRLSSVVLANSRYTARQFSYPSEVFYPQVTMEISSEETWDSRYRADVRHLRLAIMGTISSEKGQWDAVAAISIARRAGFNVTLDIFGAADQQERRAVEEQIVRLGLTDAVTWRGMAAHPMEILRSFDATVVCSRNEAFGRVTVESLLSGTPVLGYRAGGTEEILLHGGGVLVEPSPESLAIAILRVARSPQLLQRLSQEAVLNPVARATLVSAQALVERIARSHKA